MRELLFSLARRWYFVIAALLLVAMACFGVSKVVPAEYESKASLVMLPPKSTDDPGANRFLGLQQLGQAAGVVIRALNGDDTHRAVAASLADGSTYAVEPDYTTNAPILVITVTSPTSKGATALATAVEGQVPIILSRLQDDVSIAKDAQITSVTLTTAQVPALNAKKQMRSVVAAGVGLAAVLAMLIGAADGYLTRRSLRQPLLDEPPVLGDRAAPARPVDIVRGEGRRAGHASGRRVSGDGPQQGSEDEDSGRFGRANLG